MREQVQKRLAELKQEFASGEKMLMTIEKQRAELQNTLSRISGAIQVLEELLNQNPEENKLES